MKEVRKNVSLASTNEWEWPSNTSPATSAGQQQLQQQPLQYQDPDTVMGSCESVLSNPYGIQYFKVGEHSSFRLLIPVAHS